MAEYTLPTFVENGWPRDPARLHLGDVTYVIKQGHPFEVPGGQRYGGGGVHICLEDADGHSMVIARSQSLYRAKVWITTQLSVIAIQHHKPLEK